MNKKLELPDGSYRVWDIQNYFKCIIRKHGTLTGNLLIRIYVNQIKNKIKFKIKAGYYLELLTLETIKLLGALKC